MTDTPQFDFKLHVGFLTDSKSLGYSVGAPAVKLIVVSVTLQASVIAQP